MDEKVDAPAAFVVGRYTLEWVDEDHVRITWNYNALSWSYEVCGGDLESVLSFGMECARGKVTEQDRAS